MRILGLVCGLLLGSGALLAEEAVKLTNGYWPPIQAQSSPHYGIASHIVSRAFELEGVQVSYDFFPWKRAMMLALTKEWDGTFVWSYTKKRTEDFAYSDLVLEINDHAVSLKEKKIIFDGIESLKPWRVSITIGYHYGEPFEALRASDQVRVQENQTDIDSIQKLLSNKADVFLVSKPVGQYLIRAYFPSDIERFHLSEKPTRQADFFVLFSKNSEGYQKRLQTFNKGLAQLKKSGEYQAMIQTLSEGGYDPKKNDKN
jgi:polar amino acid transport system substrate-binding protein